jgi:hypothetical protein
LRDLGELSFDLHDDDFVRMLQRLGDELLNSKD